jgi:hypothetical protein
MQSKKGSQPKKCAVNGCTNNATLIVMLEDIYHQGRPWEERFCERDKSVPFMCPGCAEKNEAGKIGIGRGSSYPFSKWGVPGRVTGWTTYRDLKTKRKVIVP